MEALPIVLEALGGHLIVVCNGMIGREVFSIQDRPSNFYMIGSMGIAASIALGLAHSAPERKIACIEGDGNTLMGLGNLAQVAADAPKNLVHICLDNGAHASTGDQKTISPRLELEKIARAAGYRRALRAGTTGELRQAMRDLVSSDGPAFLVATVDSGMVPGIARIDIDPPRLAARMRDAVGREPS